jgi:hypothetical protein
MIAAEMLVPWILAPNLHDKQAEKRHAHQKLSPKTSKAG